LQVLSLSGLSELTGIGPKCICDPSERHAKGRSGAKGRKTLADVAEGRKNATAVDSGARLELERLAVYGGCGACEVKREARRAKRLSRKLTKAKESRLGRRTTTPSPSGVSTWLNTLRRARPDLLGNASAAAGDFAGNMTGEGASSSVGRSKEGGGASGGGCAVGGGMCSCPLLLLHVAGGEDEEGGVDCQTQLPAPKRVDVGDIGRQGNDGRDVGVGGGYEPRSVDMLASCRDLGSDGVDEAGPILEDGGGLRSVNLSSVAKVDVDVVAGDPGEGDAGGETKAAAKNASFQVSRLSVPRHVRDEGDQGARGEEPLSGGLGGLALRGLGLTSCMSLWTKPLEDSRIEEF
jgi:hypothetical protein